MTFLSKILAASSIALLAGAASAQIVPTGPFTGQQSEGFETQPSNTFFTCVTGRVFNNTADLCDSTGGSLLIATGWQFACTIFPHSSGHFLGSAGGPAQYTFDQPATRFGGYFGTNSGYADATIDFFDVGGNLLTSLTATYPGNCSWTWAGWQVTGGPAIKSIKVTGLNPYGGGFVDMDSLEVDYGTPCPLPVTYCTAKVNSLGCTPDIDFSGTPSASAGSGFVVKGQNVRNNKTGLLFYGMSGPAATPFQGGTLCVKSPIKRTPGVSSGGTPAPANDCTGIYSIDMNQFAVGGGGGSPDPLLVVPGTQVNCQFWGRDPGFPAPNNTTLSDALKYTVCP